MLYLNGDHIDQIGIDWGKLIAIIGQAVRIMHTSDFSQPVKPYLRYGDPRNRIIAMPAYLGGASPLAGIKWIASFPGNIDTGRPRASSITILNQFDTGVPQCVINSAVVSSIRTASVSGAIIAKFIGLREKKRYTVGIIGLGPIGQMHLKMITSMIGKALDKVLLFDRRGSAVLEPELKDIKEVSICASWEECYSMADIFIACTVAERPYINKEPKKGSLQLNVSLRDYMVETRKYMDIIVVDDWEEVCRQNTDIENMHKSSGLTKEDTISMADFLCPECPGLQKEDRVIMFNPMGMAIFDIAIGGHYYAEAKRMNIGVEMPD